MKPIQLLKYSLSIICFNFFLYQVWDSYEKLSSDDIISASKTIIEDEYPMPELRFCHPTSVGNLSSSNPMNMSEFYRSKKPLTNTILGVRIGNIQYGVGTPAAPQAEFWTEEAYPALRPQAGTYALVECYTTARRNIRVKHGALNGIQLYINVSKSYKTDFNLLFVGNPGNTVFSGKTLYGTAIRALDMKSLDLSKNDSMTVATYNVQSTLKEKLSIAGEYACTPHGPDTIFSCALRAKIDYLQCRSPYDKGYDEWRVCSTVEDFKNTLSQHVISQNTSKLSYFMNELQCKIPCAYREYTVAPLSVARQGCDLPSGCENIILLEVVSVSDEVEKITEKWLYDKGNFIADVGGYLGLLLGVSILTLFDYILNTGLMLKKYIIGLS